MSDDLIEHPFESELMIYKPSKDDVHVLNPAARVIFEAFKEGKGVETIEAALRSQFEIPPERNVRADINKCLADLRAKGLLGQD